MARKTIRDVPVAGKRVFVRCDFNVTLEEGRIMDDFRITATLPTLQYLLEQNAKLILSSHLGRPKGKVAPDMSLKPVAARLTEVLGKPVKMLDDCIGDAVRAAVDTMAPGDVILLENLRFHAEEEANDGGFSKALASLADIYCNDAFGAAHRAHASTEGMAHFVSPAVAGLLMDKELTVLGDLLAAPKAPFAVVLGGAKVKDKIGVVKNLLNTADSILIGGGMAYTFIKAKGYEVGRSLLDSEQVATCSQVMETAKSSKASITIPSDVVVADQDSEEAQTAVVSIDGITSDRMGLDIGPETSKAFADVIAGAGTVFWNGPMGRFERSVFAEGTRVVAKAVGECSGTTVIGGGETLTAARQMGYGDAIDWVSTGGGASLEFLEGRAMPGVEALDKG